MIIRVLIGLVLATATLTGASAASAAPPSPTADVSTPDFSTITGLQPIRIVPSTSARPPVQREGTVTSRVFGGYAASATTGFVELALSVNGYARYCGGVALTKRWVLTAAHCLQDGGSPYESNVFGMVFPNPATRSVFLNSSGLDFDFAGSDLNFNYATGENDWAMLHVTSDIPGPHATLPISASSPTKGAPLSLYGFGAVDNVGTFSEVGQRTTLTNVEAADGSCPQYSPTLALTYHRGSQLCIGPLGPVATSSCSGDSGSALLSGTTVVGLVSSGYGCSKPSAPNLYTRVGAFIAQIQDTLDAIPDTPPPPPPVVVKAPATLTLTAPASFRAPSAPVVLTVRTFVSAQPKTATFTLTVVEPSGKTSTLGPYTSDAAGVKTVALTRTEAFSAYASLAATATTTGATSAKTITKAVPTIVLSRLALTTTRVKLGVKIAYTGTALNSTARPIIVQRLAAGKWVLYGTQTRAAAAVWMPRRVVMRICTPGNVWLVTSCTTARTW